MRIDAYTHFIPAKYFNKIVESGHADIGKRVREIPCIHDLDIRRKIVDGFKDYAQILSYPMPPKWCVMIFRFGYLSMMPEKTSRAIAAAVS